MKTRTLQINVFGPAKATDIQYQLIECQICIDGRYCTFWTTKANYEALLYDKVFIRDGKLPDGAGVINTTNVFEEIQP